jgi:hypothetical protein
MANQLAEEVKKAELAPPSDAELRAELDRERQARATAEQQAGFYRGAASAEFNRAEQATRFATSAKATDPLTDPFAKLAAEDPLLDPEKRARLLDEGARSRAREEAQKIFNEGEARRQMEREKDRAFGALESFQAAHPDIAADPEGFAAAATRARIRADAQKLNLSPTGMLQLAGQIYNESKAPSSSAPYTEPASGSPRPGGPVKPEEPPAKSMAEELYGADPADFIDDRKVPLDKYTEMFLDARNLDLVEKEKFHSGIRNVVGDIRAAKGRKAAGR